MDRPRGEGEGECEGEESQHRALRVLLAEFPISEKRKAEMLASAKPALMRRHPRRQFKSMKFVCDMGTTKIYNVVRKTDGAELAVKKVLNREDPDLQAYIDNEMMMSLACSGGDNILTYHTTHLTKRNTWLVMDWVEGGTVRQVATAAELTIPAVAYVVRETLKALVWLHRRQRAHRDIKTNNVLVGESGQILVMDFGFAFQFTREVPTNSTPAGTLLYMPPEMATQRPHNTQVDVWSLGIMVFELLTGEPPLHACTVPEIINHLVSGEAPQLPEEWQSHCVSDFVDLCLVTNPRKRATAADLLNHPFIEEACTREEWLDLIKHSIPSWPTIPRRHRANSVEAHEDEEPLV